MMAAKLIRQQSTRDLAPRWNNFTLFQDSAGV